MAEVQLPNCLAISAIAYSPLKIHPIFTLTHPSKDQARRWVAVCVTADYPERGGESIPKYLSLTPFPFFLYMGKCLDRSGCKEKNWGNNYPAGSIFSNKPRIPRAGILFTLKLDPVTGHPVLPSSVK